MIIITQNEHFEDLYEERFRHEPFQQTETNRTNQVKKHFLLKNFV